VADRWTLGLNLSSAALKGLMLCLALLCLLHVATAFVLPAFPALRTQAVCLHETKNANGAAASDKQTQNDTNKDVTEAVNKARLNAEEVSVLCKMFAY
jgi:hypothetical protein